jgi:signal transduction histidine kinase
MKKWGIRARVLFLALLPSVTILLTLVGYFTYMRIAEVDVVLAQRGNSLARQLAPGAEFALFAGDSSALDRLAQSVAREAGVASVTITDARGQVVAGATSTIARNGDATARFTQPVLATRLDTADVPEQMGPSSAPAKVGGITVAMSRASARADQRHLLIVGLGIGSASLLLAVVLALGIGNSVIRPIRRLAGAMEKLSRGAHVEPLLSEGGGEFRALNEGFNDMAKRLQADTKALQARIEIATRELVAQKDAAEHATQAKSRFIAAASHDLRQPLHAIGLFTATLQRRTQGSEIETIVSDLAKAVSAMERLFDTLLDISKLDAGTLVVEPRPFRLGGLFAQVYAEHADAATEKGLRLAVRPTSAVLVTDELLLHRLLSNLVANAIRYTSQGTVLLCCRRRGAAWQIEVRDSGIGIPPEKQSEVFQEFYQIGNAARDRNRGLGLGLAIVTRIARLLETEVSLRSAPMRGSVFSLRIRAGEAHWVHETTRSDSTLARPGQPLPAILVVDDDPLVLAGSKALLSELGCEVTLVGDATGAHAAIAMVPGKPVLVLCDLWLSDVLSGIDLLRQLASLTDAPFSGILITGDTRPETIRSANDAGYPLLHKPVAPAKLRAVLTHFAWKMRKMTDAGTCDEDSAG